jgi:CRISPR-associated Csx2 family protein
VATRLVMFLGRPSGPIVHEQGTNRYKTTTYRFDDGRDYTTSVFGVALFNWLRETCDEQIESLHVFGTSGSQWDSLIELVQDVNDLDDTRQGQYLELVEAVSKQLVNDDHLNKTASALRDALGVVTHCHLVSAEVSLSDQYNLFRELATVCDRNDRLYMDVTHGFRHFPMLGINSALFFRQLLSVNIEGIYYGQIDGFVVKLAALDEIAEWTAALSIFERTGLLGPIADLYATAGLNEQASPLSTLAFHLATSRHTRLADSARQAVSALGKAVEHPIHEVIGPQLVRTLRERFLRDTHVAFIERRLAAQALESRDWTQAAINLYESLLSAAIGDPRQRGDRHARTDADKAFKDQSPLEYADMNMFHELKNLRNIFAHGNDADAGNARQRDLANNLNRCRQFLEEAAQMVDRVLPGLIANPLV